MTHGANNSLKGLETTTEPAKDNAEQLASDGDTTQDSQPDKEEDISGITSRKDLLGEEADEPNDEPLSSSVTSRLRKPANLDEERKSYTMLATLVLNNGTGRKDDKQDEYDEFFNPERNIPLGKEKLLDFLDGIELEETRLDAEIDESLSRTANKTSIWGKLAYAAKEIGKLTLTAVPKVVDALLPSSLQTTPKLEMVKGLQAQQADRLRAAHQEYQQDLRVLDRKYDAIKEYATQFYGDIIKPFNVDDSEELLCFMKQCMEDTNHLHFQNVQRMIDKDLADRTAAYEALKTEIKTDPSAEESIKEIRESSWLLRSIDKAKAKFGQWKENAEDIYMTKVGKPAVEKTLGYAKTELAIPVPTTASQKSRKGSTPPRGPREPASKTGKWMPRLAAGLALITAGLFAGDVAQDAEPTAAIDSPVAQLPEQTDNEHNINVPSDTDSQKETVQQKNVTPAPVVVAPLVSKQPVRKAQAVRPHRALRPPLRTSPRHEAAKALQIPKTAVDVEINPEKTAEIEPPNKSENVKPEVKVLSEPEKMAEMRLVEGKVAAYKRRIASIQLDQKRYEFVPDIGTRIDSRLAKIPTMLDDVSSGMKSLERADQLTQINTRLQQIDTLLNQADFYVRAVNLADASQAQIKASDLLESTSKLAQKGPIFTIVHSNNTNSTVTAYNVDIAQIQNRLNTIHAQVKDGSQLSVEQARMLHKDADYWVGYLKFVNWYLQHNPKQVVVQH